MRAFSILALAVAAGVLACHSGARAESATYNGTDGHVYVLQTGILDDLRTWQDAKSFCNGVQFNGKPSLLCPYRNPALGDSEAAIRTLCGSRHKTCWLDGETKQGGPGEMLCPLVTAFDEVVYQGCLQVVSFVCRSADPVNKPTAAPAPVPTSAPAPVPVPEPVPGQQPVPAYGPGPVPVPQPGLEGPRAGDASSVPLGPYKQKSFNGIDGPTYTLFFLGAVRTWAEAGEYCNTIGQELAPYKTDSLYAGDSAFAVNLLCARSTATTCWLGERPVESATYNGTDGHVYVLQTGILDDLRTWQDAKSFCNGVQFNGKPSLLCPYRNPALGDSEAAIRTLCGSRHKTCWLDGETKQGGPGEMLCPLVTAFDEVVYQGCLQVVSFVCRSADPVNKPAAAPAPVPTSAPVPVPVPEPVPGQQPVPAYGPGPVPVPQPGLEGPRAGDASSVPLGPYKQKSFNGIDGRSYTLFFLGAVRTWAEAGEYCNTIGQELAPYKTDSLYAGDSAFAVNLLCARSTATTCWLGERPVGHEGSGDMLCPMIDQAGTKHYQDCGQPMAFVCRTVQAESKPSNDTSKDPTPWRLAPTPVRTYAGADGRHYTLYSGPQRSRRTHRAALDYCADMSQELAPYDPDASPSGPVGDSVRAVHALCGGNASLTCWVLAKSIDGLCPVYSGHDNKVYWQGCIQLVSWVCRTAQPITFPDLNGDKLEEEGPIARLPDPAAEVAYPNSDDGYKYTLFRGDAPNRRNYTDAVEFCESLGGELSPFNRRAPDGNSVRAVRFLCGGAATTCWVRQRMVGSQYCPLVSQEVVAQWQTCDQKINFVCRVKMGLEIGKRR
ncbi:zsp2b [Gonium pectorale]|uniref:Zsp2b n=1 Tax=Gonium pectorale TaxID=33097 RepID=A0A150GA40_GONPE|nr:zsp2b [Gonium pectorale]|eukprot:KXZ46717.1 zsp2b [Gonium pectorale]